MYIHTILGFIPCTSLLFWDSSHIHPYYTGICPMYIHTILRFIPCTSILYWDSSHVHPYPTRICPMYIHTLLVFVLCTSILYWDLSHVHPYSTGIHLMYIYTLVGFVPCTSILYWDSSYGHLYSTLPIWLAYIMSDVLITRSSHYSWTVLRSICFHGAHVHSVLVNSPKFTKNWKILKSKFWFIEMSASFHLRPLYWHLVDWLVMAIY